MDTFHRPTDSPSSLDTFRGCPKKYHLSYAVAEGRPNVVSTESAAGTAAHYGLERVAPSVMRGEQVSDNMMRCLVEGELRSIFRNNFVMQPKPERTREWAREHAGQCAINGLRLLEERHRNGWQLVGAEVPLERQMTDEWKVAGIADLILEKDGVVEVADWKCGSVPRPQWADKVKRQLSVYLLCSDAAFATAIYLGRTPPVSISVDNSEEMREALTEDLLSIYADIRDETEWEARPSQLCKWCALSVLGRAYDKDGEPLWCMEGAEYVEANK